MKRIICILMISGLVFIGCVRFTGVKPIYPEVGYHNTIPSRVESLQPTFRWEPSSGAVTYDFIIYEAIDKGSFWKRIQLSVGPEIYYREGLKEQEHRIEEPLKPRTKYYWSVRIRKEQEVFNWSVYDVRATFNIPFWNVAKGYHYPFLFDTPER